MVLLNEHHLGFYRPSKQMPNLDLGRNVGSHDSSLSWLICSDVVMTCVCVMQAAFCALTEEGMAVKQVKQRHFVQVLRHLCPTLSQHQVDWYSRYKKCDI
jgi:NAD dependent epimerase/dehydratase family enzyme